MHSENGNPRFSSLSTILDALGMKLQLIPKLQASPEKDKTAGELTAKYANYAKEHPVKEFKPLINAKLTLIPEGKKI